MTNGDGAASAARPDRVSRSARAFWLTSGLWLAADQLTKGLVVRAGPPGTVLATVIPDYLELTHSRNPGAAFSLLAGHQGARWLFSAVAVLAVVLIIGCRRAIWALPAVERFGLALVAAGAAGNLADRLCRGGLVVDFIRCHLYFGHWSYLWPDFNIADSGVVCGMLLYVGHTLYAEWAAPPAATEA